MVDLSGPALDWFKFAVISQLALGLTLLTVVVALAVVHFWRGG